MHNKRVVVTLDGFEQRLMVNGLVEFKNTLQRQGKPPEDVEDLILKIIDAPTEKERRHDREMR
ncbi:MAG: hypothetical protein IK082_07995 [Oscillospiraceae bacterium]|nr:hypothetical protein [Oscillospiraceae bacterium]